MPSHKSSVKRVKQTKRRTLRNKMVTSSLKTAVKKITTLIDTKDLETAETLLRDTISQYDKAASSGILHKNTSSRKVSKLVKKVNELRAEKA